MSTTFVKVKTKLPQGEYKPTLIDQRKSEACFRLLQVDPYVIRWKDGKTETVTRRTLKKLQSNFNWMTDF